MEMIRRTLSQVDFKPLNHNILTSLDRRALVLLRKTTRLV